MQGRAVEGIAGASAALLANEKVVRTALYFCWRARPVGNCHGRTRRPSPRHHSPAPCITAAAARGVSRLPSAFRFWFLFGGTADENFAADTQTLRYQVVP
jgi:hypothetical protein